MAQKNRNYYTSENLNASNQKIRSNLYNDVKQHSNQENHIQSKHSRKPKRRLSFKNLMLSALVMFCVTIVSFTLNSESNELEDSFFTAIKNNKSKLWLILLQVI